MKSAAASCGLRQPREALPSVRASRVASTEQVTRTEGEPDERFQRPDRVEPYREGPLVRGAREHRYRRDGGDAACDQPDGKEGTPRRGPDHVVAMLGEAGSLELLRPSSANARAEDGTLRGVRVEFPELGSSTSQSPSRERGQRGWKRQPSGGLIGLERLQSTIGRRFRASSGLGAGTADISAPVYGMPRVTCKSCGRSAISTALPRYMTMTRSEMRGTTSRS